MKYTWLVALLFMCGSASAFGISISSGDASVSLDTSMPLAGSLLSETVLNDGYIESSTDIRGNGESVKLKSSMSGGGDSFSSVVDAGEIQNTQIATSDGITGEVKSGELDIFSSDEIGFLASNPDMILSEEALTVSGKTVSATGGNYPSGGTFDPTATWYIDPASTFKWTTYGFDPYTIEYPTVRISHDLIKNSLQTASNEWNAAAGKSVVDGVVESSSLGAYLNDGKNTVMLAPAFQMYGEAAHTRILYSTSTRKVLDVDIKVSEKFATYGSPLLTYLFRHETGHAIGMTHNPYSNTSVMNPNVGTTRGLSGDDKTFAWVKYNY